MANKTFLFLGCGNMGEPVLQSFLLSGIPVSSVMVSVPSQERLKELEQKYGIQAYDKDIPVDILVCAIKPQQFLDIDIKSISFNKDAIILSIMAGIPLEGLKRHSGLSKAIRCMPNMPLSLKKGMTSFISSGLTQDEESSLASLFTSAGKIFPLELEEDMSMATVLAGCLPGILFEMGRIFEQEAQKMGVSPEMSEAMVRSALIGGASLLESSSESFESLAKKVASKGGTTEAMIHSLHQNNIADSIAKSFKAGSARAEEMAEKYS